MFQGRLRESSSQIPLLNLLHNVPTHDQMPRDVLHRHQSGEFQRVAFEGSGVTESRIGEAESDLPYRAAVAAFDARKFRLHEGVIRADRQIMKEAFGAAASNHILALAGRTAHLMRLGFDMERSAMRFGFQSRELVAGDVEELINYFLGHADPLE
jgi:hypothetical protein